MTKGVRVGLIRVILFPPLIMLGFTFTFHPVLEPYYSILKNRVKV